MTKIKKQTYKKKRRQTYLKKKSRQRNQRQRVERS